MIKQTKNMMYNLWISEGFLLLRWSMSYFSVHKSAPPGGMEVQPLWMYNGTEMSESYREFSVQ